MEFATSLAMPTVYLAGPIAGLHYSTTVGWRSNAIDVLSKYGIVALSPMRHKEYLDNGVPIHNQPYDQLLSTDEAIMTRDYFDVRRSHAVLAFLPPGDRASIGTMFELAWSYQLQKPLVVVMGEMETNVHDHPFVRSAASLIVNNFDDAFYFLKTLFNVG